MIDLDFVLGLSKRDTDISEHIQFLYLLPFTIGAKTIVELGAGQSTYALCAIAKELNAQFYSIDVGSGARERLFEGNGHLLDEEPVYHFIQADDHDAIKSWTSKIDFLFIDTSHEYEHTVFELEMWGKMVRSGGLIAMHDTGVNNTVFFGCRKAVLDFLILNLNYKAIHFPNQSGFSILRKL